MQELLNNDWVGSRNHDGECENGQGSQEKDSSMEEETETADEAGKVAEKADEDVKGDEGGMLWAKKQIGWSIKTLDGVEGQDGAERSGGCFLRR
jgi:hypothetical protein